MPYSFNWAVNDRDSGNDFGQEEQSDGNVVRGSYRVLLPDGRVQIVTYTADHENGYQATVEYQGEAVYPTQNSNRRPSQNSYASPSAPTQASYGASAPSNRYGV